MNNLLQQLRGLNPQDIGSWPIPFKLAGLLMLFLLVLAASAWFDWKPQIEEMNAAVEEETKLRDTFMTKKAMAVNLDAYKKLNI